MRFLIVEDDVVSAVIMEKFLSPYGPCTIATDGLMGVKVFESALSIDPYDLVWLDIMLPRMDGQEVLKNIRSLEEKKGIFGEDRVKIIMTTALGDHLSIMEAFRSQCEGYIVKPVSRQKIIEQLVSQGLLEKSS
jgi:two-component system, chemotaxis family, chemotaxis protein CheY